MVIKWRNSAMLKWQTMSIHLSWLFLLSSYSDTRVRLFPCCPSLGTSAPPPAQTHWLWDRARGESTKQQMHKKIILVNNSTATLTSPAECTGKFTAQEASPNDCDGLDVAGHFIQWLEILDLWRRAKFQICFCRCMPSKFYINGYHYQDSSLNSFWIILYVF